MIYQQLELLPERLGWHVLLTLAALACGIVISLPVAIIAFRRRTLRGPLLGVASVIQTVPSLALLALMYLLVSRIGFWPAFIALVLYSILPILRNTVTGLIGVDPAMVEAARGVGMTEGQVLRKVQLPLAAPMIIAGIRTSAVWLVGIATLSTPVGQESLGNYIFEGLQLRNNAAVATGVFAAAGLAIVLDLLIRLMEMASERRSGVMAALAALGLCVVMGGGLAPLLVETFGGRSAAAAAAGLAAATTLPTDAALAGGGNGGGGECVVGAKTFTEQYILASLLRQRLDDCGFRARRVQGMGSTILFDALSNGNIDCYVDYSGTIWATVMKRTEAPSSPEAALAQVSQYLKDQYGIVCVGRLGFENAYALAMSRARADELGVHTLADLADLAPRLRLGGDYEFFGRPEWKKVSQTYGLEFAKTIGLDSTLMYQAVRDGQVDVVAAFSSDGRIAAYDLRVLKDPRHAFPPYDAILLVSPQAAVRQGFVQSLRPLIGGIDDEAMRQANKMVDLDHQTPQAAATYLLKRVEAPPSGTDRATAREDTATAP